jgi:hypothetical protein
MDPCDSLSAGALINSKRSWPPNFLSSDMSGLFDVAKKAYLAVSRRTTPAQMIQVAPTQTTRVHAEKVWTFAFFKDGRRIVTPKNKALQIWDVEK